VLRENCNNAIFNFALAHEQFDLVGDFIGALSCCRDSELFRFYTHVRAH